MKMKLLLILLCAIAIENTKASNVLAVLAQKAIEWNTLNNAKDFTQLEELYANEVVGYGKQIAKDVFMGRKRGFLKKVKGYSQSIVSNFTITEYESGVYKCEFDKKANSSVPPHQFKTYKSYLVFLKIDGAYKIIEEGDEVTNKNSYYLPSLGKVKDVTVVANEKVLSVNEKGSGSNWLLIGMLIVSASGLLLVGMYFVRVRHKVTIDAEPKAQVIKEAVSAPVNPEFKNENERMGRVFEEYIVKKFDPVYFKVLIWQSDKSIDGMHADANQDPDLIVRLTNNKGNFKFALECKYRSSIDQVNNFEFCREVQFFRYKNYGREHDMPVFIALGIGGKPNHPKELFIIPINDCEDHCIRYTYIQKYKQNINRKFFFNPDEARLSLYWK